MTATTTATATTPTTPTTPTTATATTDAPASAPVGAGGLLRIGALPVETWLLAGSPQLFDRLRSHDARVSTWERRARDAAADLGDQLVPHPLLDAATRSVVLAARRALHRGSLPAGAATVLGVVDRLLPAMSARLRWLATERAALDLDRHDLDRRVDTEDQRLLATPWPLLLAHPCGRAAIRTGDLAVCADIAARVAAGEPWTSKRMRQRSDYLWRIVTRAATRATPRGWLAQVAAVRVRIDSGWADAGWSGSGELRIDTTVAADQVENLDRRGARAVTVAMMLTDPTVTAAVAPLAWSTPEQLVVWTLAGDRRDRLGEVRLRRTPVLAALLAEFSAGARPVGPVLDALAGGDHGARERLAGLLVHLVGVGAVQVAAPPRRTMLSWRPLDAVPATSIVDLSGSTGDGAVAALDRYVDGYVDVYRRSADDLSAEYADRLGGLAALARRTMALIDDDVREPPDLPPGLDERPRPLLALAAACVRDDVVVNRRRPHHHDWPLLRDAGSGYARLFRWLTARMDMAGPGATIDLSESILDRLGAPDEPLDWPVDCLLRPLRGPAVAVLDQIAPAGVLDARFAPALTELVAPPQVDAYGRFLDRFARQTGRPTVEILAPPLSPRAANAVRRPGYAAFWTGDPDRAGYVDSGPGSYLPLDRITLRRAGDQVVAEVDGQPIWPVLHTTRLMAPPWDTITALLLLASPQPDRQRWRSLRYSLPAWPRRAAVPRITVGSALIVTAAQWRLSTVELWRPGDRLADKLLALARLRQRRGMPRLVSVAADVHQDPVAVDLDSLPGLHVLDRFRQQGATDLLVRELLAEPDRLPVTDGAAGGRACLAELLLRLPVATPADAFADRVALGWADRLTAQMAVEPETDRSPVDHDSPERTL